ncbi:hypothetical protein Pla175_17200 [Pirellulimonas nuda]|uniref:Inner membrane protein n=1 Tax=Pirellulimonas nuda TaxID=2528009 RepID=A0A518DA34_9BACT|nr:metal-dependent hydrolase [Pirellulimonas nuda]QDU88345.1 hypothetical protein Pla175_17200 [Pirellulimonas nuda]
MADFKTHVTFSGVLGCGYTAAGLMTGVPPATAFVAGGLCGVSGMLPDIDSDSGRPRREAMSFAAAIVPMLLVDRFRQLELSHDCMVLFAAVLYVGIRFVGARLIGRWSVHRGMFHSIPAALIFAGLAFLIAGATDLQMRYFKAFGVFIGVISHLVLDEVYSVDMRGIRPKLKKSFGTAVKFWGNDSWANFSTYAKLVAVFLAILSEPMVLQRIEMRNPRLANRIREYREDLGFNGRDPSDGVATQPSVAPPGAAATYYPPANPQGWAPQGSTGGFSPPPPGFAPNAVAPPAQNNWGDWPR